MNTRIPGLLSFSGTKIVATTVLAFALCSAHCAVFTVTNVNDSGPGSLRSALTNADSAASTNIIQFNLSGAGPFTIVPLTSLPALTMPVVLDGWSQTGWTNLPLVQINGGSVPGSYGLVLNSSNSLVRGLSIFGFKSGSVLIDGVRADGNRLQGNCFGTDAAGFNAYASTNGVVITNGASSNLIGADWDSTNDAAEANYIAYNTSCGVSVTSSNCIQNRIWGNSIYQNGNRGIQLGTGGTVTNDFDELVTGPNLFENSPAIGGAYNDTSSPLILASLQGAPNQTYHLEFFSSPGIATGSGAFFLGFTNVTTDATGAVTIVFPSAPWPSSDSSITATATDPAGNTSEFSPAFLLAIAPSITSVTPSHGNTAGGYILTIQGGPFAPPCTVLLGGNECPVLSLSLTTLQCYAPAGAGTHQAVVVINFGQVSNPLYFNYDSPVILGMNPSYGSHAGGTVVTLTGLNFGTAATVTCGLPSLVLTNTQTLIQFVTPPDTATNVPVTVTLAGQTSAPVEFNYEPEGPVRLGLANNGGLLTLQTSQLTPYSENFIETCTNLSAGIWFPYTNFIAATNSASWALPNSAGQAFFRVRSR
jgi:hypothetical protein